MSQLVIRIKQIQKKLSVSQSGIYDLATLNAIEKILGINPLSRINSLEIRSAIQKKLGFTGKNVDGILGVNSTTRIEELVNTVLPPIPKGAHMIVSRTSMEVIIESEVSSRSAYNTKYKYPVWPGGESGITIGIGYDIGFTTVAQFESDWKGLLSDSVINKLKTVVGKKGNNAKAALVSSIKSIVVPLEAALTVFYTISLPKYAKSTAGIYPGIEKLPPDAQGALLSIVYNRGASLTGSTRVEMKNIQAWVAQQNLPKIAAEIRSMKRLWPSLRGLLIRRDREADLVLNATYYVAPSELVFV